MSKNTRPSEIVGVDVPAASGSTVRSSLGKINDVRHSSVSEQLVTYASVSSSVSGRERLDVLSFLDEFD